MISIEQLRMIYPKLYRQTMEFRDRLNKLIETIEKNKPDMDMREQVDKLKALMKDLQIS